MEKETLDINCTYCGISGELTRDHVPPKCLFPKPRAPQITVPACKTCNQNFQKDDEYFAIAMVAPAYSTHEGAIKVWEQNLLPIVSRGGGFRRMLSQNILEDNVITPAGIFLPEHRFIRFEKERINSVITRIVRGLLWHHYQAKPSIDTKFVIYKDPPLNIQIADLINSITNLSWIGDDIFRYRHSPADGDPNGSIWCLQFYGCNEFLVLSIGRSFFELWNNSDVT